MALLIIIIPRQMHGSGKLTCWKWSAFGFVFECAELLDVIEEKSRRASVQVGEAVDTLERITGGEEGGEREGWTLKYL